MRKAGMDAAAKALGMSVGDLQSALSSGQTLTSLSSDRATQIAQRMIAGPGT